MCIQHLGWNTSVCTYCVITFCNSKHWQDTTCDLCAATHKHLSVVSDATAYNKCIFYDTTRCSTSSECRWKRRPGRAIAQAVSRRLPTAAARVRCQVTSCRICGGQSVTGADFLPVLRFTLPILIPPTVPRSLSSSGAGTIGQLVADVPSGLSLTPPQESERTDGLHVWEVTVNTVVLR
jgi:hypothetical protein